VILRERRRSSGLDGVVREDIASIVMAVVMVVHLGRLIFDARGRRLKERRIARKSETKFLKLMNCATKFTVLPGLISHARVVI
jgi:hypothetical protein